MSLPVACSCGARFAVDETLVDQVVHCPECDAEVKVPGAQRMALRTSGYAIASVVAAMVGAFTVGSTVAVGLGMVALVAISRQRNRLTGAGFAIFGIVTGLAFTALTLFAYSAVEVFGVADQVREGMMAGKVERGGPLEVLREKHGFAITRPSSRWGVARPELIRELDNESDLMLVHPGKDAYLDVVARDMGGESLEAYVERIQTSYREPVQANLFDPKSNLPLSGFKLRYKKRLPQVGEMQIMELRFDVRVAGQPMAFLYRTVKEDGSNRGFDLRAWTWQRRFPQVESELREALDSFRLLP